MFPTLELHYDIIFESTKENIEIMKIFYELFYPLETFHIEGLYNGYTLTCNGKIVTHVS